MYRPAAFHCAGNLRNDESRELKLRVPLCRAFAELNERFGGLLGRHDAEVADFAAPDGVGIVEGDDVVDEVRAIVCNEFVGLCVLGQIELGDEAFIVFSGSRKLKAIECAVVGRANKLIPVRGFFVFGGKRIRDDVRKMLDAILVAEKPDEFWVGEKGNVFGPFDGVKIGNERNGDPVVTGDVMITRQNDTEFAGITAAKLRGACCTDVREIDSSVTGAG